MIRLKFFLVYISLFFSEVRFVFWNSILFILRLVELVQLKIENFKSLLVRWQNIKIYIAYRLPQEFIYIAWRLRHAIRVWAWYSWQGIDVWTEIVNEWGYRFLGIEVIIQK